MLKRAFINKEETGAPGFKAGRVRLILLLCANIVEFTIGIALVYKAVNL